VFRQLQVLSHSVKVDGVEQREYMTHEVKYPTGHAHVRFPSNSDYFMLELRGEWMWHWLNSCWPSPIGPTRYVMGGVGSDKSGHTLCPMFRSLAAI